MTAGSSEHALLVSELKRDHVRSLMTEHLTDVASSEHHTVKPWFSGRLDFSPPVPDLREQGFELVGGRVDLVGEAPAAVLVYRRRQHQISLFLWLRSGDGTTSRTSDAKHGYHVVSWDQGELRYAAVSDLNPSELEDFASAVARATVR
jgi:anti-sigma factor RsiW